MVKATDVIPYLTPDEATQHGMKAHITGEGSIEEREFQGEKRKRLELPVRFTDGFEKLWTPNNTTVKLLATEWGDDTASWVNKQVVFSIVKMNVRGTLKDVIYGEAYVETGETKRISKAK